MTPEQRQKVFDALMHGVEKHLKDEPTALQLFEATALADLDVLDPVIDEMITEALISGSQAFTAIKTGAGEVVTEVIRDGGDSILKVAMNGKVMTITFETTRLRDLCNFLLKETEK